MQILIFCPAGKSFTVNETCEFLNYSLKNIFSAILICDTKLLDSKGSGVWKGGNGTWAEAQ